MDLYRIDSHEEFELLGTDEMIYGTGITVIEWSEKIQSLLPIETIAISIDIEKSGVRNFHINGIEL